MPTIDRALRGADARRNAETRALLSDWLKRPRRDGWRDWRGDARYPACGPDRACQPLPVLDRIDTDFLWQRSPFCYGAAVMARLRMQGLITCCLIGWGAFTALIWIDQQTQVICCQKAKGRKLNSMEPQQFFLTYPILSSSSVLVGDS